MSQQIEYAIVSATHNDLLTVSVMARILEGWRPIGGVAVMVETKHGSVPIHNQVRFLQAIIREKRT